MIITIKQPLQKCNIFIMRHGKFTRNFRQIIATEHRITTKDWLYKN